MRCGQYKNLFLSFRHLPYSACNLGPFWTILQRIYIELRSDSKFSDVRIRPHLQLGVFWKLFCGTVLILSVICRDALAYCLLAFWAILNPIHIDLQCQAPNIHCVG